MTSCFFTPPQVPSRIRQARHAVVGERGVRRRVRVRVHAAVRGWVRGVRAGREGAARGSRGRQRQQPAHSHPTTRGDQPIDSIHQQY